MFARRLMPALCCATLLACGFNSQTAEGNGTAPAAETASPNRINREEILSNGGATAYDVVDKLHHRWFKDQLSGREVTVYFNNSPVDGGAAALRDFPSREVAALEYYDGQAAVQQWGVDRAGGVIVVIRNQK